MKIVMTCGVFDLLHEGHINLLTEMKKRGDITLAVVHDGFTTFQNKRKLPIENLEKRTRNLIDTGLVDIIRYTFEAEPISAFYKIIEDYQARGLDIEFVRGDDWDTFPGKAVLVERNIPISFIPYTAAVSSSKLRAEL